ncbi:PREDICTED: putative disease resistance protein RGA3 [Theobroma cacao]|uniref:Disease resistance protein RGA3 n=1 Tax=Theobroma cacao TaxID=3641 RepID=A0AB32WJC9_THECC|nr:PREDICTED: putative disease resistance protein RGA3 [Theobroma cacao]XP_017979919.1 PREDICTED: putative disease resistance protein RGA3 [Theobroma cacao]XP_017979920.1 PREDICTED: putative disease resistance protein RGA3 [Theobroma cacao]XP_017979921.1 PREDICTED: putative disease resistance protein RGA3 [Theobroma cacao]XP_017979922.1 PREDICTED: putative disease resistance protein RGA3 [Theobroma cacao]XP_017979923.1 PREDICTED: putative disease resistance protein RGA3 [Theobroma cacao]XP_01
MAVSFLYEMVGNMLSNFVSDFVSNTVSGAGQRLCLIFKRDEDLEKIRDTLTTVKEFSLDAEEKQESDPALKKSIIEVQDVVYDADDLLDEIDYEILGEKVRAREQEPGVHARKKVRKLISSFEMGPKIKEIRGRLDKAAAVISTFNLRKRVAEQDKKAKCIYRETASKVRSEIIGREKDKGEIIKLLLQEQNDHGDSISIVAIVGFGGLGKTSLAQLVYNDAEVESYFQRRIWVCVSEEFNVGIIFKKILESLEGDKVNDLCLDIYVDKLQEKLKGKKYLLVLDDVWNENNLEWDKFSQYLVFGASGSKILVTTRNKTVSSTMGVHDPYLLKGLNEDQSWVLFKQVAFQGQGQIDTDLRVIGGDVARKCKGVPLVLKCLGGLMRQKPDKNYWSSVQKNEIWKVLEKDDSIFPVLQLSYIHLPRHLKQCFAFCSLFPKDFKIFKDKLIRSWQAQGYIQLMENENVQDIGEEYFNNLLSRSFFQEEEKDAVGNIICCKMHDLIHDLALSVTGHHFHWMKDEKENISKRVRHVSSEKNSKEVVLTLLETKEIRTIFFRTHIFEDLFLQNVTFSCFNCLRMLNLSRMDIDILPDSIGELKHLRYLDLSSNNKMKVLPDTITKLHHLQTLLLEHCTSLEELPRDIQHLISLEYLNIDNCQALKYLSKGLRELTSLQRLGRFIVNSVEESFSAAATLNELRDLNDLRNSLTIEHLEKVKNVEFESKEANLKKKKRLQSLKLYWRSPLHWSPSSLASVEKDESLLNNLEPHPNLKELMVSSYGGARFSSWLSSLTNLVDLQIAHLRNCQRLPPLDHFSSLKSLTLYFSNALKRLPPLDHLSSLKCLVLVELNALEYVAESFPLHRSRSGKPFFPSLKTLCIRRCSNLKGWWRTKNENQGSIAELLCFPCLSMLEIMGCPDLTSMPLFPSLDQNLTLADASIRPLQQTLKMTMTEANMTLEEASSSSMSTCHSYSSATFPLSNLKRLRLEGIKDLEVLLEEFLLPYCPKLESLLPQKMSCLTSLQQLWVQNCPNLKDLPDWILNLTSLRSLQINECLELQSIPEGTPQLTSLEELSVQNCHNLRALPEWILNLTSLKTLRIWECLELQYMPKGTHQLTSLKELFVGKCPNLRALPDWILNLTSLKTLRIWECLELQYMPKGTHQLTSLKELLVGKCPNLRALPDWILNLTSLTKLHIQECLELQYMPEGTHQLTSLKELSIENCPHLRALPDWILNLTSLETLQIWNCLELQYMPVGISRLTFLEELYADRHNLRALQDWILNLTSLKDLYICECLASPYLQERMHNLTSLQRMIVESCPNLSSSRHSLKTLLIRGCPDIYSWRMRHSLSSLEELNVQNCPNLGKLLYRISFLITCLKTLTICKCPELQNLQMVDRLTSLQVLSISECPKLSERCEKETGILWPHIAHIPSIIIDGQQIQ